MPKAYWDDRDPPEPMQAPWRWYSLLPLFFVVIIIIVVIICVMTWCDVALLIVWCVRAPMVTITTAIFSMITIAVIIASTTVIAITYLISVIAVTSTITTSSHHHFAIASSSLSSPSSPLQV